MFYIPYSHTCKLERDISFLNFAAIWTQKFFHTVAYTNLQMFPQYIVAILYMWYVILDRGYYAVSYSINYGFKWLLTLYHIVYGSTIYRDHEG